MRHRRRPLTAEERIRNAVLRRRRAADHNALRRAEKLGAPAVHIRLVDIAGRDGQTCYLCGKDIPLPEATFEHVIPLSNGGSHTPGNVRLAHQVCNSRKGARPLCDIDFSEW